MLKKHLGKEIQVQLKKGTVYTGKLLECDGEFIEMQTEETVIIRLDEVQRFRIL